MPADIECAAWVADGQEDDEQPLHECHLQYGHRTLHECLCGETWSQVGPFGVDLLRGPEALAAAAKLLREAQPPVPGYRRLDEQQRIWAARDRG